MTQVIGLQVEELQGSVLAEGQGKHVSGHVRQSVAFELHLAKSLVCEEGTSKVLPLLISDAFSCQVNRLQTCVVGDNLSEDLGARSSKYKSRAGVVKRSLVLGCLDHEGQQSTSEMLASSCLVGFLLGVEGCLLSSQVTLHVLSLTLFLAVALQLILFFLFYSLKFLFMSPLRFSFLKQLFGVLVGR